MNFSISVKFDLPNVILLKLWFISIQRKRSASQYIKGPQRNWSMYDQRDRWSTYRTISADMIVLVQGFGQSHLLLDIQVTTFHISSELTFLKKKMSKASKLLLMTLLYIKW
jgi:hypothetical protein